MGGSKTSSHAQQGNKRAAGNDDEVLQLPPLPLATAIRQHNLQHLARALQAHLPATVERLSDLELQQTAGEAFTGGRSTPVYTVSCTVHKHDGTTKQRHFVIKLVWMTLTADADEHTRAATEHLRLSYAVERRFYDSDFATRMRAASLTIPRLIGSDLDGTKAWPVVCLVMNDLAHSGFTEHPDFLSVRQARSALQWIAHVHALFWKETPPPRDATAAALWPLGGFWNVKFTSCPTSRIAANWMGTVTWLSSSKQTVYKGSPQTTKGVGKRLQALSQPLQQYLTSTSDLMPNYGTLVHGDYKAANLFLRPFDNDDTGDDAVEGAAATAVVDFQYTGYGIGAFDVAYLLYPDARGDFWDAEEALLRAYHETLVERLVIECKGGPSSLSFDVFRALYDLVRIQLTCYWIAKGWVASTPGEAKLVQVLEETIQRIDGGAGLASVEEYTSALERFTYGAGSP